MHTYASQTSYASRGDLHLGLEYMVEWFLSRTDMILRDVHFYLKLLFALYLVHLVLVFYFCLFRNTTNKANVELENARRFVFAMPMHIVAVSRTITVL